MKNLLYLILVMIIMASSAKTQGIQFATGTVYLDVNANGRKDRNEQGLSNVAVTNGVDVVLTDAGGQYWLPVSTDAIIAVIKPSQFRLPVNELNLPQFFYIHKPEGSPELKYAGVAPTGSLPKSIDFGLLQGSDSDKFSIMVFSDPQPYSEEETQYFAKSIAEELKNSQGFEFGITLGDIVGDIPDYFPLISQGTAKIGIPWFNVLGNHDVNFDVTDYKYADESFEAFFGPANYAFNQGKVHFIVLNNVLFPNPYDDRLYVGGFREEQFQFIENSLRFVPNDHLLVISGHIPLFNEFPFGETFLNEHRERLFRILKDRPHTLSFSGHTHTQRHHFFSAEEGWLQEEPHHHYNVATASGDWWSGKKDDKGIPDGVMRDGTPKGYNLIYFDGASYTIDYKATGYPEMKMRVYGPRVVPQNSRFRSELFVNFFQGSSKCKVEYRINDEDEWRLMRYTIEQDPYIAALRYEWDMAPELQSGVRPSNPVNSYHLWKTRMPTQLPLGKNTFEIRATDMHGRFHYETFEFMVVEPEIE